MFPFSAYFSSIQHLPRLLYVESDDEKYNQEQNEDDRDRVDSATDGPAHFIHSFPVGFLRTEWLTFQSTLDPFVRETLTA